MTPVVLLYNIMFVPICHSDLMLSTVQECIILAKIKHGTLSVRLHASVLLHAFHKVCQNFMQGGLVQTRQGKVSLIGTLE